jgi:hypothetical protein
MYIGQRVRSVNWEHVVEGTRKETRHKHTENLPISSAEQPVTLERVTPGKYRIQVYSFTVDDPWSMYPTVSIQERLNGISQSIKVKDERNALRYSVVKLNSLIGSLIFCVLFDLRNVISII